MKRILTLTLAGAVALSSTVYAKDFSDLKPDFWGYENIMEMQKKGVIDGYEDGTFRPEKYVTRGETAKILSMLSGISEGNAEFSDVDSNDWFGKFAKAVGEYIPSEKGNFEGNTPITREDAAVAAVKILKIPENKMALTFSDRDDITYRGEIAAAVVEGIITGFEDNTFRPEDKLTRAQLCAMYDRAFSEKEEIREKPAEKSWTATKLCDADIENFMTDAAINEEGRLMFIEKDESELIFRVDFKEEEPHRSILWNTKKLVLDRDLGDGGKYFDFVPLSMFFDNNNNKTHLFGYFRKFADNSGNQTDKIKYTVLDITTDSGYIYSLPDESYIPHKEAKNAPELLFISAEEDLILYNGHKEVCRMEADSGRYRAELYKGNGDKFSAFLNNYDEIFAIDTQKRLNWYDRYNLKWDDSKKTFKANAIGTKDKLFWLWDAEGGKLYTSDTDGKETVLYDDMKLENIENLNIEIEKLDSCIKVLEKDKLVVYDGTSLYLIERK